MVSKKTTSSRKSILISGDVMVDNHIYQGSRLQPGQTGGIGTYLRQTGGGARLLYDVLDAVRTYKSPETKDSKSGKDVSPPEFDLDLGIKTDDLTSWPLSLHSFGVWSPCLRTKKPGEKQNVWRLSSPLGYGETISAKFTAPHREKVLAKRADILLLDDGGLTFRHIDAKDSWPATILAKARTMPEWIILKMSSPLVRGDLWRAVSDDRLSEKLVVVTSIADIRNEPVRVSEGVSWERTALELVDELSGNPSLEALKRCKHCIVSLGCGGALHVDRSASTPAFRLIFDPAHLEGDLESTVDGSAIGYMSCLAAGIVSKLAGTVAAESEADLFRAGIVAGLEAGRAMLMEGHGIVEENVRPAPPLDLVAGAIVNLELGRQRYFSASVPSPSDESPPQRENWTILAGVPAAEDSDTQFVRPLMGIARRVALFGISELERIPVQRIGKLITVDRGEIESLRIVQRAIRAYEDHDSGKKPLSIALFGAPGSGKSFTVKEIAKSALGKKVPILEFNLSQFSGPADLIGALHQVRDKALGPYTPVVFWDEFDSRNNEWLQYLLAPMQDGAFQQGQLRHPIGKCVFVFAGGTCCAFEHFGPSSANAKRVTEFKELKGPDFKSRINNSLTVLGPNRAPVYDDTCDAYEDDPMDICFPIRRALLLRAILGLKEDEELEIDDGMLTALLQIGKYSHGVRSLENVLTHIKRASDGRSTLRRSDLPNTEVLALHVNCAEFVELMDRDLGFKRLANELAPYIHGFYNENIRKSGAEAVYRQAFEHLSEEMKDVNRSAARRIPEVLGHAGLYVVQRPESDRGKKAKLEKHVEKVISDNIDQLAEAEHNGWMVTHLSNGWRYGIPRNDADKTHDNLKVYSDLDEPTKKKDIDAVDAYKDILATFNYTITNKRPK